MFFVAEGGIFGHRKPLLERRFWFWKEVDDGKEGVKDACIYKGLVLTVGRGEGDVLSKRGLKMQRGEEWHKEVFTCPSTRMHWTRLRKRTFSTNTRFCFFVS